MTEIASGHEAAWAAFQASEQLRLQHETLEWEWTRGRTDFIAFLIAISEEGVRGYIAAQVEKIADIPGVEAYPERYWHITVKGVGFLADTPSRPDEVSLDDVRRLAEQAQPLIESTPMFNVQVGPANGFPEVVYLEAHDDGTVRGLNKQLLADVPGLTRSPFDGDVFLPHISVARFTSNEGLPELKRRLAGLREGPAGPTFRATEVLLIQAHLSTEAPTFDLLALYPLRQS